MSASTAKQSAIIPRISSTGTAPSAGSPTAETIDGFIKRHLKEAGSESFSAIKHTADRASQLGFSGCANLRYVEFLEALRSSPALSSAYAEKYPSCYFLPWAAIHAIRRALKLSLDTASNYAGAVPASQLPWIELFERSAEDDPCVSDYITMMDLGPGHQGFEDRIRFTLGEAAWRSGGVNVWSRREDKIGRYHTPQPGQQLLIRDANVIAPLLESYRDFRSQFFVLAPPDAFHTEKDFIIRAREMVREARRDTTPPPDPLVLKFCTGGALVVAAWGDEAELINEAAKEVTG